MVTVGIKSTRVEGLMCLIIFLSFHLKVKKQNYFPKGQIGYWQNLHFKHRPWVPISAIVSRVMRFPARTLGSITSEMAVE